MIQLAKLPHNEVEPQTRFNNERFEFAFYDDNGLAYYRIANNKQTPAIRMAYTLEAYIKFISAIDDADLTSFLEAIHNAIHSKDAKGNMRPDIARIGYLTLMMQNRKGLIVHKELLSGLAAHYFFREDESLIYIDEDIFNAKREMFAQKPEIIEDLFFAKGFNELFPYLDDINGLMAEVIKISGEKLAAEAKIINQHA